MASTRRAFLIVAGAGALVVVAYYLLSAFHVGSIGTSTDIGGGLLALLGYVLLGVGLVGALVTTVVGVVTARRTR